ncbi:cyclic di-GMP receptor LapD [Pectobacterium odoriferum]|uniref:DeoR faimly transcriptional regulator n=1 Tax=Pectobacterium odoriferum TaxID=78398 RepID=A0ABD6VPK7_9GAMM|nr:EAL domain-containing protein [Pectobacterium odoriferum]KGA28361.1 DeoR faimly transcriptional regulator [Pectobacterium odoriferum]KGA40593.1 DeoR faimly transcriptional regulator [Pectobacterium odoriferum]MBA0186604.1 EAL domain-containing protein [Pectobacterium odoriferum]POD90816.1 GGDEF domain-containing protein [Pectobacterium odoriferum]POD95821.1 GGDEF domain-containing protein [Pectobacterium odoriferum]
MSLYKQLLIAICLFVLIIFSGSFFVSLENSREQYNNQLHSHAQDAATALGLSLTPNIDDPAMVELMVSSIFDSGYFSSIRVRDLKTDNVTLERTASPDIPDVPLWFVRLVNLQPGAGEAIVMRGWEQAAKVEVVSHPMFAVTRLWRSSTATFLWLLGCGTLGVFLGALFLRRQLRPLDYIVDQSLAITRREFLSQPDLPNTPEFRRVAQAMNLMVSKLKTLFEEEAERSERLRQEAYQDPQTGLNNRRAFDMQFNDKLADEETAPGFLIMIRVQDLAGMNQRLGGQRTDALLASVGHILRKTQKQHTNAESLLARIRGGEFALFCPGLVAKEAYVLIGELTRNIETLHLTGETDVSPVAQFGMVPFRPGDTAQSLFIQGDQALTRAESDTDTTAPHEMPSVSAEQVETDRHMWFNLLDPILEQERLQLFLQPVVACDNPSQVLHHKVLARIQDAQGNSIAAGRFLPWIQRFGWDSRLDQTMLREVLDYLRQHDGNLALSLSGTTVLNLHLLADLLSPLKHQPDVARRLILELDENQLPDSTQLEALIKLLNEHGCALGLQHFGGRFNMIGNLSQWGLAYLKVDGSYIRNIDQEDDKQMFIEALYRATNSIALPLIAERVETAGELKVLQEMGLQGAMGRLLGEPVPAVRI